MFVYEMNKALGDKKKNFCNVKQITNDLFTISVLKIIFVKKLFLVNICLFFNNNKFNKMKNIYLICVYFEIHSM